MTVWSIKFSVWPTSTLIEQVVVTFKVKTSTHKEGNEVLLVTWWKFHINKLSIEN